MAVLELNAAQFEAHCPFGIDPGTDIFASLQQYFALAYDDLCQSLLGRQLGDLMPTLMNDSEDEGELSECSRYIIPLTRSEIIQQVIEYTCKRAMFLAIPSLDLVLTPNGFGVIQSHDLIPAIPERVNRLRLQCRIDCDIAYDALLKGLPGNSLTREAVFNSMQWKKATAHLIWSATDFLDLCGKNKEDYIHTGSREYLTTNWNRILQIENKMKWTISFGQFTDFIDAIRNNVKDDTIIQAIEYLLQWLSEAFQSTDYSVDRADGILLNFMDDNIESFASYANSSQYHARHHEICHKKNKESGCFIFR